MSFDDSILHHNQLAEGFLKQGKINMYIHHLEQIYLLKRENYGPLYAETQQILDTLITTLNHQGIASLQKQDMQNSIQYLKKAEEYSASDQHKVSTYNNLACFYRRIGKLRMALTYLQQALQIELILPNSGTLSDTYLNLCAVLSQLDRHDDALQHIYLSIIMLQHELLMKTLNHDRNASKASMINETQSSTHDSSRLSFYLKPTKLQDRLAVLVVAYHNLGVEMEHLKKVLFLQMNSKNLEAQKIYQSALNLAERNLHKNHQMLSILQKLSKEPQKVTQSTDRNALPGLNLGKNRYQMPRMTLTKLTKNSKNGGIFAPVISFEHTTPNETNQSIQGTLRPPSRFAPISYNSNPITQRLKSISVSSPLEAQQIDSLRTKSLDQTISVI